MNRDVLRRLLPHPDRIRSSRLVSWLGPRVAHPRLWHLNRRGIALGLAIGVFFGFLIPVAQIPLAAVLAIALRANLAAAVASTLVTNPFTFGPIYVLAYQLGVHLVGPREVIAAGEEATESAMSYAAAAWSWLASLGGPLALGLAIFAIAGALLAYFGADLAWRAGVWLRWRRRAALRRAPAR